MICPSCSRGLVRTLIETAVGRPVRPLATRRVQPELRLQHYVARTFSSTPLRKKPDPLAEQEHSENTDATADAAQQSASGGENPAPKKSNNARKREERQAAAQALGRSGSIQDVSSVRNQPVEERDGSSPKPSKEKTTKLRQEHDDEEDDTHWEEQISEEEMAKFLIPEQRSGRELENDTRRDKQASKKDTRRDRQVSKKDKAESSKPEQKPPRKREEWEIYKESLKKKFGDADWNPMRRLSPDALEGIRALHAADPKKYSTPALASEFKVSPEAIRRILKSKWRPNEEEAENRALRWEKRGHKIWERLAETGVRPPKKWRDMGAGRVEGGRNVIAPYKRGPLKNGKRRMLPYDVIPFTTEGLRVDDPSEYLAEMDPEYEGVLDVPGGDDYSGRIL